MKGIIMAGGEGTRLRPITCDLPKPMVPVINRPVMEYSLELLKKHGIEDIGVTLQYLPDRIRTYFGDGSPWGVKLKYYVEETPLGTAGSVKNAEDFLNETFIVISGDALTDIDLSKAIQFHKEKQSIATLVMKQVGIPLEYGVIITDDEGRVVRFLEKPGWGEVFSDTVNTGIYILEPEILSYFTQGERFDFSKDLFPILLEKNKPMYGYITEDYWCDIGDLDQYLQAHYDVLDGKVDIQIKGDQVKDKVWIEEGAIIDKKVTIKAPCVIGRNAEILAGSTIGPYSVIGEGCCIGASSTVKKSVLWNRATTGINVELRATVLCNRVQLEDMVSLFEGTAVGENTIICARSMVKPGVKVWPGKTVEASAVIYQNIVWGARLKKALFGKDGIKGTINIELTPEFISAVAATYGATFAGKAKIAVSAGPGSGPLLLKEAAKIGLQSEGANVFDLGQITLPMMRYGVRYFDFQGGIHIHSLDGNPNHALVEIIDKNGANISRDLERKIENLFTRQDFKRTSPGQIQKVNEVRDIPLYYRRNLISTLDVDSIKNKGFKVVLAGSSRELLQYFVQIINEIGCSVCEMKVIDKAKGAIANIVRNVRENEADLGFYIDGNGETMVIVDEMGTMIKDERLTALISLIVLKSQISSKLIIPFNAPSVIDRVAAQYQGQVMRSKSTRQSVMEHIFKCDVEEMLTRTEIFNLYFDGIASAAKIIELLCKWDISLSELMKELPAFHINQKTIECPWIDKGKVIRSLIENEGKENTLELIEGVKVNHTKGWALILPDADEPICKVYSEGFSEEYAESLTDMYIEKIREIRKS